MKKEDVIGKKACGVAVSTRANCYVKALDNYVGKVGIISGKWSDGFSIRFDDGRDWSYPIKSLEEAIKLAETSTSTTESFPEKWSVGSYVVFCKDIWHYKIGDIDIITEIPSSNEVMALKGAGAVDINREQQGTFKWFATKEEAEAFAKTLTKVEEKVEDKFIVGQWYRLGKWISKFEKLEEDYKFWGEGINTKFKFYNETGWLNINEGYPILITDLSEIQQYLPDGHVDKVVVTERTKTITKEVLLVYAKEHYPVGTEFNNTNLYPSHVISDAVVSKNDHEWCGSIIQVSCKNDIRTLYKEGKWAEIVKPAVMTKEDLIAEARRRYPIGTVFSNSNLGLGCDNIRVTGIEFIVSGKVLLIAGNSNQYYGQYTVYKDGKWAEITTPVVSSLSTTIAVKHWGPDLIGKEFVSQVANLDSSLCQKEIPYTIIRVLDNQLCFKLDKHSTFYISKSNFLKHCKLVPASGLSIPTIQETKSTVNYTVSTALTELSVNIPHGRKTKQVPVITIELSQINCNL